MRTCSVLWKQRHLEPRSCWFVSVQFFAAIGTAKKTKVVNMKNIRKKMGVTPGEKRYIVNELGVGYRMLAEDEG